MAQYVHLLRCAAALTVAMYGSVHADHPTITTKTESTFLYPPSGPPIPVPGNNEGETDRLLPVFSESWQTGFGDPYHAGGFAYGKATYVPVNPNDPHDGFMQYGVAAFARSRGIFTGSASVNLHAKHLVHVFIEDDGGGAMQRAGCHTAAGCRLATTFQHITHGRLAYSPSIDRAATFEGRLRISSASVGGTVGVDFNPLTGHAGLIGPTDDWIDATLTPFGPTPMDQLHLFPAGDPRNSVQELSGFEFGHIALIKDLEVGFHPAIYEGKIGIQGIYSSSITQIATAGAGTDYIYSTLAVDFANTSTFSVDHVIDPSGQIDLSLATLSVTFTSAVPEPAAWLLWLAALPVCFLKRLSA